MISILLIVCLTVATTTTQKYESVASQAQIRFAEESKYDGTGPGAKHPEYAYKVYRDPTEALIAFLEDPDTKLPDGERYRALQALIRANRIYENLYPNDVRPPSEPRNIGTNTQNPNIRNYFIKNPGYKTEYRAQVRPRVDENAGIIPSDRNGYQTKYLQKTRLSPIRYQNVARNGLFNVDRQFSNPDQGRHEEFDPNPKYSYSYGVHDKETGDNKSFQESRDGDVVKGHYSFLDADGKLRSVQYSSDGEHGFRALVERRDAQ